MPVQNIPSTGQYSGTNTAPNRERRDSGRSFADLYRESLNNSTNDNGGDNAANRRLTTAPVRKTVDNQKYIEGLHEQVDAVRGEIMARVIETSQNPKVNPGKMTDDITRLSVRLDSLRQKLATEENRLSGTLVNIEI